MLLFDIPLCFQTNAYVRKQSTQFSFQVFKRATCLYPSGQQQANTFNIRHKRELQPWGDLQGQNVSLYYTLINVIA